MHVTLDLCDKVSCRGREGEHVHYCYLLIVHDVQNRANSLNHSQGTKLIDNGVTPFVFLMKELNKHNSRRINARYTSLWKGCLLVIAMLIRFVHGTLLVCKNKNYIYYKNSHTGHKTSSMMMLHLLPNHHLPSMVLVSNSGRCTPSPALM